MSYCRVRTSSGMFMRRGGDKVIRNIEKRIADYTFIPVGMAVKEPFIKLVLTAAVPAVILINMFLSMCSPVISFLVDSKSVEFLL